MKDQKAYIKKTLYYVAGALSAGLITLFVYFSAVSEWFVGRDLAIVALGLATLQLVVQLLTFLHLNEEKGPKWKIHSLWFALLMAFIIVVGSIWIMVNLNYNMSI